jgi:transglutaminase-like putative cysteine protease
MARRPTPPAPRQPAELSSAQWSMTVTPVVAAVTTLCASLALSGVIEGVRWWGYTGVAVTVVTAVGLGLRAVRTPILLVGFAQMFALLCLLVALFTDSGVLGLLPGPEAFADLGQVLRDSVEIVRTGVPPVAASSAVLCLVVIAIGMVAVLVDTLAVSAGTPAACGLVLLCVYAVPASLADEMLPWWAFVLGAASFSALLAVDGAHRHQQWRNRPTVQGTGGGVGSPSSLVAGAVAIALFAGATVTGIGTVGQLPGGTGGSGSDGLGLDPFTSLRGSLDRDSNKELFRVRNLGDEARYLRALTLAEYDENGGWGKPDSMPEGEPANRPLPLPKGQVTYGPGNSVEIEIEPLNSRDVWAPVFGTPRRLENLPQDMRYDPESGAVYGSSARVLDPYIEEADLSQPSAEALRSARPATVEDISEVYFRNEGFDDSVVDLANQIIAGKSNVFDQVRAIEDHFDPENGFTYDVKTAVGSAESALTDFLFESQSGFCEQYASAMAILLRAVDIPSRVAMGYTAGVDSGEYRTITSLNAHAWVEVFFPDLGWVQFDPTPLSDGSSYTPPYATESNSSTPEEDPRSSGERPTPTTTAAGPAPNAEDPDAGGTNAKDDDPDQSESSPWLWWTIGALIVVSAFVTVLATQARGRPSRQRGSRRSPVPLAALAAGGWVLTVLFAAALVSWWLSALIVLAFLAGVPRMLRERLRARHRRQIHSPSPTAASSAWAELVAESTDRGVEPNSTDTLRATARRLASQHELDQEGRRALRTVVAEVERSWYGGHPKPNDGFAAAFDQVIAGLRRSNPIGWRAKLFPRSVLRRKR